MNTVTFISLLLYTIIHIVCVATASCPCHIPCTGKPEICTCFGPCGDDGYGCKSNGDDYDFLSQQQCKESEWVVQCIRTATCSKHNTLDDTNPFAAYENAAIGDNMLNQDDAYFTYDDDQQEEQLNAQASLAWFGGNWFDFWGKNSDQFFADDKMQRQQAKTKQNTNDNFGFDDDEITIDNQGDELFAPQASQRSLQHTVSSQRQKHGAVLDDLGHNQAGYRIIAIPLYVLIICIVSASIIGMLMCAGFVWCGVNCCCPLPASSPSLASQQRSHAVQMAQVMRSLTLGGGQKSYDSDQEQGVYRRMSRYLHNPTNDEASSVGSNHSLSPRNRGRNRKAVQRRRNDNDDEYANDSEDDKKEPNEITAGNIHDEDYADYDFQERNAGGYRLRSLHRTCDSDIGSDSDEEEVFQAGAYSQHDDDAHKELDIEEEEEVEVGVEEQEENKHQEEEDGVDDDEQRNETEYEEVDELTPLKPKSDANNTVNEDMLGMAGMNKEENHLESEVTETENEEVPLLQNGDNRKDGRMDGGNDNADNSSVRTSKSSNLP